MSEIKDKVIKIIKSQSLSDSDLSKVLSEIDLMDDSHVLQDLYVLYSTIKSNPSRIGDKNPFNSLTAFVLGITSVKPTGDFVLPEKRRTYGRSGFPDVDMDFDYLRRHEVLEYLITKYGKDKVANIGTTLTLKIKKALRSVIKVLDPANSLRYDENGKLIKTDKNENFALENEILNTIPEIQKRADGTDIKTVDEAYKEWPEFKKYMDAYPEVFKYAKHIQGAACASGMHAAGIVISPVPLNEICPLHLTKEQNYSSDEEQSEKKAATQYNAPEVESLGLIKFDILGLSTKTAITLCVHLIKERYGIDIDLAHLPLNDKKTLDLLSSGKTDGCFQLENYGMKQALQQIGVDCFDDLIAVIAMYRPGPKDYIPLYSARKKKLSKVQYQHPLMQSITEKTYGILCFQEQIMQAFMALADLSASDGYLFMKGCAKKKQTLIEKFKEQFFQGAQKNQVKEESIKKIWSDMELFGGYAFNKSHATSYAYESFKTAYLKSHYPLEFFVARLSVESERRTKAAREYVLKCENDAKRNFGIEILDVDINESKKRYRIVDQKTIRRPLCCVKGLGDKAVEEIVINQPFKGPDIVYSFASRVGNSVNSKAIEAMYDAGLWNHVQGKNGKTISKAQLLKNFETIKSDKKRSRGRPHGQEFE